MRSVACADTIKCRNKPAFDKSKSSSFVDTGPNSPKMSYLDGTSVQGRYSTDVMYVGSTIMIPDFKFVNAWSVADSNIDGIAGMSLASFYSGDLMVKELMHYGNLSAPVFSYFLDETQVVETRNSL